VESDALRSPPRWSVRQIRRFTLVFGLVSSVFDGVTFLILLRLPGMHAATFRSGWFIESLVSEVLVLLIVRTRLPVWRARPGTTLLLVSAAVLVGATALVQSAAGRSLGFEPLSLALLTTVVSIAAVYAVCVEILKRRLYSLAS
jgi:Mg2+-importing ATPase